MLKLITFIFCCLLLAGCRTMAPVSSTQSHEINTSFRMQKDTMFRDRWHCVYVKGDTVYIHDSIDVYRNRTLRDTVYRFVGDTVTVKIPVAAQLNGWQRFIQSIGYAGLGLLIGIVAWFLMKLIIKFV